MFVARTEKEVMDLLQNQQVDTILLEPLWGIDLLTEDQGEIKNIRIGEVGFILFNKIQKAFPHVRTILLTVISHENIVEAGFPEDLVYLRSPVGSKVVIDTLG